MRLDADGKVLKRHEHEHDVDHRDLKCVRFTHKQPDKRADLELTDDSVAKRAKICLTHHHPVLQATRLRNLPDSHGGIEDSESRESGIEKSCVDADTEISAIEALTNAKLEVDPALDTANKTLHRLLEEIPLESDADTNAAELNNIRDERVYTEVYESEANAKIAKEQ